MQLEAKKYLFDIARAAELLAQFVASKRFEDYEMEPMLRAAVEREFAIIGEAVSKLAQAAPEVASRISDYRRIIAFRNLLIHGYADLDDRLVWEMTGTRLDLLRREIAILLAGS